ncbi:MAG: aldolase [Candidatus Rokubacteria bacterium]|nr:aldolase [Candidatus Rokubacteria bacterium]
MKPAKEPFDGRAIAEMEQHLVVPEWTVKQKIALTCRILAGEGHESALAGQITARAELGTFWALRFGLGFDEATASSLLRVDDDLRRVEGEGMPNPSNRFHLWIYRARPDVNCIIHTHPPHVSALSMLGEELIVSHMDTSMFYEDCAFLPEWPGVPIGDEEGEIISRALGDKRAVLLAHHGQLVACSTVEEAAVMAVFFERAARLQLMARAVAPIRPVRPELAREAHDYRLKSRPVGATFHYFARRVLRNEPGCLD